MQRIVLDCDNCGAEGEAETVGPFDLGDGPKSPDLCPDCQSVLQVERLLYLASEYGVAPDVTVTTQPRKQPQGYPAGGTPCPVCRKPIMGTRTMVVKHLATQHNMSIAEASRAIPIAGPTDTCEVCGYIGAVHGGGMRLHRNKHVERGEVSAA